MITQHGLFFATLGGITFVLLYSSWCGRESLRATFAWCDARDEFTLWRRENPYIYIGLSDIGKHLLTQYILAFDAYLALHPHIDGRERRAELMRLFDDLPPRPHKPTPKKLPHGSFFNMVHILIPFAENKEVPYNALWIVTTKSPLGESNEQYRT